MENHNQQPRLWIRRQYRVLNYILDFYCPQYELPIEIIGDVHAEMEGVVQDGSFQPPPSPLLYKEGESRFMTYCVGTITIQRALHTRYESRRA